MMNSNTEITERQKEIINVSLELIAEKGIQGLTIKNIAQKMEFTEAAVYRHYETKIQILNAILDFFKDNFKHFFEKEISLKGSAIKKIEQVFRNHFSMFTQTPSLVAVIFSEEIFRNEPVLSEKVKEIMKMNFQTIRMIIETGQKNDEIRNDANPEYLTTIVMGTLRLFIKQWQMSNYSFDLTKKGSELINTIGILIK